MIECFLGLGGNICKSFEIIEAALKLLAAAHGIYHLKASRPYLTSPVSNIAQADFLNAVCQCTTSLNLEEFFKLTQKIEASLGKVTKAKNEPRIIDIDLLFYGQESLNLPTLNIPHPCWKERLFVLMPLSELRRNIVLQEAGMLKEVNIDLLIKRALLRNQEQVYLLNKNFEL